MVDKQEVREFLQGGAKTSRKVFSEAVIFAQPQDYDLRAVAQVDSPDTQELEDFKNDVVSVSSTFEYEDIFYDVNLAQSEPRDYELSKVVAYYAEVQDLGSYKNVPTEICIVKATYEDGICNAGSNIGTLIEISPRTNSEQILKDLIEQYYKPFGGSPVSYSDVG